MLKLLRPVIEADPRRLVEHQRPHEAIRGAGARHVDPDRQHTRDTSLQVEDVLRRCLRVGTSTRVRNTGSDFASALTATVSPVEAGPSWKSTRRAFIVSNVNSVLESWNPMSDAVIAMLPGGTPDIRNHPALSEIESLTIVPSRIRRTTAPGSALPLVSTTRPITWPAWAMTRSVALAAAIP